MTGPGRPASSPPDAGGTESVYWLKTRRLTGGLLLAWFVVTFLSAYFARDIDMMLFGWPFSFWLAAQGALLCFLAIVGIYAWRMERLEDEMGDDEGADAGPAVGQPGGQAGGFNQGSDSARSR